MKFVFIIGDAAVGKMTVGQELMKITDLRLFHNHDVSVRRVNQPTLLNPDHSVQYLEI